MKKLAGAGVCLLACLGLNVAAQDWYHDRDVRYQRDDWRMHMFDEIKADLEHVQDAALPTGKEGRRLERTKQELSDLQAKLASHHFDKGELDDVIDSLKKSANDEHLDSRGRDVLHDDLSRLRDYREHHDNWGR